MVKSSEIKLLKFLVYAMGVSLIFTALSLTYIAYYKSFGEPEYAPMTKNLSCPALNLEIEGEIKDVSINGDNINVLWRNADNHLKLSIYNMCNGNLINTVSFKQQDGEGV